MIRNQVYRTIVVASLLIWVAGCATQQPVGQETGGMSRVDTPIQEVKGLPKWVTQKGAAFSGDQRVLHGVGNAAGVINPTLRRRAAGALARDAFAGMNGGGRTLRSNNLHAPFLHSLTPRFHQTP